MEDSMINMPDSVSDEKIGNKRVRDGEDEIHKGRLEKRPSGILGISDGEDYTREGGESGGGGGIIDTFISNVFHKKRSGTEDEEEVDGEVKTSVSNDVVEDECKREDLGVDGGGGDGESGGGGVISAFFSNIFNQNGSADEDGDQAKSDHLGGGVEENGGGEPEDHNAEKSSEKDKVVELPSKDPTGGNTLNRKPDDYSERVFFLNNN